MEEEREKKFVKMEERMLEMEETRHKDNTELNVEVVCKRGNDSLENGITGSSVNEGKMVVTRVHVAFACLSS